MVVSLIDFTRWARGGPPPDTTMFPVMPEVKIEEIREEAPRQPRPKYTPVNPTGGSNPRPRAQ